MAVNRPDQSIYARVIQIGRSGPVSDNGLRFVGSAATSGVPAMHVFGIAVGN